jgi:hypothetical protein
VSVATHRPGNLAVDQSDEVNGVLIMAVHVGVLKHALLDDKHLMTKIETFSEFFMGSNISDDYFCVGSWERPCRASFRVGCHIWIHEYVPLFTR